MGSKQLGISDIAIFVGTFCPHNVGFIRTHMHAHTHTIWRCLLYMHCNSLSEAIWLLFLLLITEFKFALVLLNPIHFIKPSFMRWDQLELIQTSQIQ